jgi:hypothetical protein
MCNNQKPGLQSYRFSQFIYKMAIITEGFRRMWKVAITPYFKVLTCLKEERNIINTSAQRKLNVAKMKL